MNFIINETINNRYKICVYNDGGIPIIEGDYCVSTGEISNELDCFLIVNNLCIVFNTIDNFMNCISIRNTTDNCVVWSAFFDI